MGLLDRLVTDARILFRKRLDFSETPQEAPNEGRIGVTLRVGAVELGYLSIPGSARPGRNEAYRRWLEMACRVFAEELNAPGPSAAEALPASVRKAARIIRDRYDQPLSLGDVAAAVQLSRERLSRLFHESLGITFSSYLNEVRLGEARRRLRESKQSVTTIAYASGFQSLSQFNRSFKQAQGMSPRNYREREAARVPLTPSGRGISR